MEKGSCHSCDNLRGGGRHGSTGQLLCFNTIFRFTAVLQLESHIIHKKISTTLVPAKETVSCLDPGLPGTGQQMEGAEGPGPPYSGEKSQLEPSRDGETREEIEENLFFLPWLTVFPSLSFPPTFSHPFPPSFSPSPWI